MIVVGGGVIGCAAAERLTRDGHRVTLLERDHLAGHASGAAAGLLAPYTEASLPGRFLELAERSFRMFPELAERVAAASGIDVEHSQVEGMALAFDEAGERRLGEAAAWLPASAEARLVAPGEARRLEPGLAPELVAAMLVRQARVTPARLVRGLARTAARGGAEIREGSHVTALVTSGGAVSGVRLSGEAMSADWVVLAAGPWSPQLALTAGVEVPVEPRRGQLVSLLPPEASSGRVLTAGERYLVPRPDGTVIAGSTEEEVGFDARPTAGAVLELLRFTAAAVPGLRRAALERVWAALRPATRDGLPLIGPSGCENLVVATGHHRNGILLAPVTAEIVAQGLLGRWEPVRG